MDNKKLLVLTRYLDEFKDTITDSEVSLCVEKIQHYLKNIVTSETKIESTHSHLGTIIKLIENNDMGEIEKRFPNIRIQEVLQLSTLREEIPVEVLEKFTIHELKILYFLLAGDNNGSFFKNTKKSSVLRGLKELIFTLRRVKKLDISR